MAVPDFSQYTPQGTPGASTDTLAAQGLVQQANIRSTATTKLGENQSDYLGVSVPGANGLVGGSAAQLQSSLAANGQGYGGAAQITEGAAQRHYLDSQHDIISGAHNALDDLTRQQAYAALGLII